MTDMNILNTIADNNTDSTLIVLKGIDLESCGYSKVSLADTLRNKMPRLMSLSMAPEKVIAYDEFVALYQFVISMFQKVIIIENPLYMNLYPVGVAMDDSVRDALLAHFDEESSDDTELGDIDEYTSVYSNLVRTDDGVACCFNLESYALNHEKITCVPAWNPVPAAPVVATDSKAYHHFNICNDVDYYNLIHCLYHTNDICALNLNSFAGGLEMISDQIALVNGYFKARLVVCLAANTGEPVIHYPEVKDMMEKYWGYTDFRSLPVYDIDALNKGEKKLMHISQEKIISELITEVEHCKNGKDYRDMFVTASTGSGKSLMFQLPAMYLAEKYGLLTIVITPLISLMNDQVQSMKAKGYHGARTLNSDVSPIVKNEILDEVADGTCNILYLSPESLLSRSDISQLIGSRRIGLFVVDEAHIVTTWGKQFRPDYWYLGDHVSKLRTAQGRAEENPMPFVIATFTATAVYKGVEDMYNETLNCLHMIDPITYLGYVKRDNIRIDVSEVEAIHNRTEYELDKFDSLVKMIHTALVRNQKTLIYFPTVALIERFYAYCISKKLKEYVARYHGQMKGEEKAESFDAFLTGRKPVMIATKAFGMGIDISDIAIVAHYAPTGNVCDYVQEIGRAARDQNIDGQAIYKHMRNDFQHINRLHGLSGLKKSQLTNVIVKILELFEAQRYQNKDGRWLKKRNEMLIDTESFAYIFDGPMADENNLVNKVKTAMLLIEKDYENRGFTPFRMRPIPIFAYGYLVLDEKTRTKLNQNYPGAAVVMDEAQDICKVDLKRIWDRTYQYEMSFPKFKYLLYSHSDELDFNAEFPFSTAMSVELDFEKDFRTVFRRFFQAMKDTVNESVRANCFFSEEQMMEILMKKASCNHHKAENLVNVMMAAMATFAREYNGNIHGKLYSTRPLRNGKIIYRFEPASRNFFNWIQENYEQIMAGQVENRLFVSNANNAKRSREILTVLGILESYGVLTFRSLGGSNSQIYIYVNETKSMRLVRDNPESYHNRLLQNIGKRHEESVKMMNELFQNGFTSDEIWERLENYMLGIPNEDYPA